MWLIVLIVFASIGAAAFLAFVIQRGIRAHQRQAATGREDLIGKIGTVMVSLNPKGVVFFKGEQWTAISETGRGEPGEEVIINRVDGLKLYVTPITEKEASK